LTGVAKEGLDGRDEFDEPVRFEAGAIVLVTHRFPRNSLYKELAADRRELEEAGIKHLYQVGDCVSPRMLVDTVFDGHRLARETASAPPESPLQNKREAIGPAVPAVPLG